MNRICIDEKDAGIRPKGVFGRIGFGQAGDRICTRKAGHCRNCGSRRCGIVNLGVGCRSNGQARGCNCSRGGVRCHGVVVSTVGVVHCIRRHGQCAAVRSQHVLGCKGLIQTGDVVCAQKSADSGCHTRRRLRSVIHFRIGKSADRQCSRSNCPGSLSGCDRVVTSAVSVVDRVSGNIQ